jgi:hypothetical protein
MAISTFRDFPNGIQSANDYLSANNSVNAQLSGSVADIGRFVVSAEMDFNLKEIICSLMAGRGLKLPNLQICISLNLKGLLGDFIGQIQDVLYQALASLDAAFDKFMDHLKLDAVLGRINGILGEITNIANMINFCSAPIDPIQIPNVLENAMDSFLGKGKSIIDSIGTILPDQIGGCLIDGLSSFDSGIMGRLNDVYDDLIAGSLSDDIINGIVADISLINASITDLIASETTVPTNYSQGGSDLSEDNATVTDDNGNIIGTGRTTNTGVGVLYNSVDEGIGGATSNGSAIWSAYQSLGSYQVVDSDGTVYNNIFETFCDPDLIRILRRTPNPTPEIAEQVPVRNYCGEIIGYTKLVSQADPDVSIGTVPGAIADPGFDAGGLPTNPTNAAQATDAAQSSSTTTTTIVTSDVTGLSLGNGQDVFAQKSGSNLEFRSITAGDNVTITQSASEIEISSAISELSNTATTTTAAVTEILFNGSRQTPTTDKAWFVTVTAVANRSDASGVTAIKIEGLVDNNAGTITLPGGGGNKTTYNGTSSTDNYNVLFDVTSNQFRVRIQGDTGHTVDWKVKFDFIEA